MSSKYLAALAVFLFCNFNFFGDLFLNGRIPGDLGDARLIAILLEHTYQFTFHTWIQEFWSPPWAFFPAQNILALSDNLVSASPVYMIFRLLNFTPLTSFQFWLITCSALNFLFFFLFLRYLRFKVFESSIGAMLFAYSLPRAGFLDHPQLSTHFFTPLALIGSIFYFRAQTFSKKTIGLLLTAILVSLQFWSSLYLGWFFCLALIVMACGALVSATQRKKLFSRVKDDALPILIAAMCFLATTLPLIYKYGGASAGAANRPWNQVNFTLPMLGNYLFPFQGSYFYSFLGFSAPHLFGGMKSWQEKQMFPGVIAIAALGFLFFYRKRRAPLALNSEQQSILYFSALTLGALFLLSISLGKDFSLWQIIYNFVPGAKGVRAVSRIILIMLIPWAILVALVLSHLRRTWLRPRYALFGVAAFAVLEHSMAIGKSFHKITHEQRVDSLIAQITSECSPHSKVFLYQKPGPPWETHLDAMWTSITLKIPTINGYSGAHPPGWTSHGFTYAEKVELASIKEWLHLYDLKFKDEEICQIRGK